MNNEYFNIGVLAIIILIIVIIIALCVIFSYFTSTIKVTNNDVTDTDALEAKGHLERITIMLWLFFLIYFSISIYVFVQFSSESKIKDPEDCNKKILNAQISILTYVLGTISFVFTIGLMALSSRVCANLQSSSTLSNNKKIYNLCLSTAIISGIIILMVVIFLVLQALSYKNKKSSVDNTHHAS